MNFGCFPGQKHGGFFWWFKTILSHCVKFQLVTNFFEVKTSHYSVFLTHISIWQMLTWLPTWKAKSLYHVSTFLPTWFFLPLQKFKTIKIKLEKKTYTQAKYMLFSLSLGNCKQLRKCNHLYRSSLSAMFFFNRY